MVKKNNVVLTTAWFLFLSASPHWLCPHYTVGDTLTMDKSPIQSIFKETQLPI